MRFTEIGMEAYEEFRKAFENEPENGGETKLAEAFNRAFLDAVKAKVKDIRILDSGPVVDPYRLNEVKLILNKGKRSQSATRIDIPMKAVVDSLDPPVRFIIAARSANFSYNVEQKAGYMSPGQTVSTPAGAITTAGTMGGGGRSKVITLSLSFIVWDYRKDAPVVYRKFSSVMSASFFFTQEEWTGMMELAALNIVRNLP